MKFRRKQRENVDVNLASLIDVVFILLLFFVMTSGNDGEKFKTSAL